MNHKKRFLALFLSLFILTSGCSKITIPTNANTAFKNFTFCLFQQEVSSNALNLHYSLQEPEKHGITETPTTLGTFDFNEISTLASIENLDNALHKFSYRTLSDENKITYDILEYYFSILKADTAYYLYEEPLSPITGIHAQLPILLAEYRFYKPEDVKTYLTLLKTMPDYFASLVRFEQQKAAAGLFMSDTQADAVVEQCNAFLSMGNDNYLFSTFAERLDEIPKLSSSEKETLMQENQAIVTDCILPAYETLADSLTALKGSGKTDGGLCSLKNGKEYYTHLVMRETGSSKNIAELKSRIKKQLSSDLTDLQSTIAKYPNLAEQTVDITETPDTILKNLETKISASFPTAASVNVQVKYVPTVLENYLSPAFYLIPAIDNYSENTIYINPAHNLADIHLFTTLAHEGYPGHLYQTTYFAGTNPDPIRTVLSFTGYVEGWATYAEMCSYYISPLEKPHATLLQKNNSLILGLYANADVGIHYDGWSVSDTLRFFSTYGIDDSDTVQEIYDSIVGDPANYLSYYIGYLEILDLKKETDLSQKEFHQKILEIGPAPFDVVEKYLED